MNRILSIAVVASTLAVRGLAASSALPSLLPAGQNALSTPMQIILLMTALTLLPAMIMSITPFLRISIVLHFLRQALGTQSAPSNQVLTGLALFLTLVSIQPLVSQIYKEGWEPVESGQMTAAQGYEAGAKPLKAYLSRFVREKDVRLFLDLTHTPPPRTPDGLDLRILAPSYILSEMRAGFQIGAVIFLPFLLIDIVVASVTLSIGMVQLPPAMVSAPFKLLLFVLVDGWNLTVGSLMKGFFFA
ncbi:MAG: flagellar type III secretion system pore protein FliP [Acidobacteriota bacterium]|nr:flagellar type III secretion system pore protein FliP [Acidobacteriota bacterium]